MIARFVLILVFLFAIAGCISPSKIRFIDVPYHAGIPTVKKVRADGNILRISVIQNGVAVFAAGIEPQVIDGDVYLSVRCISSVVQATEFSVDLSDARFPRDWKQRLYWIEQDAISSPINPFIDHLREIHRSKVVIETQI